MKLTPLLAVATALTALAPAAAPAATFVKFSDRATFTGAAGPVKTETFNSIAADIDLATAHDMGDFSLVHYRGFGPYGSSSIDAAPFIAAGNSPNGTTYVESSVYNFSAGFSSLVITFDEAITAFGGNFSSGSVNQLDLMIDGEPLLGSVATAGSFFGFLSDKPFTRIEFRARSGSGFRYTLDNFTYSNTAVPEPATWAMMIGGFGLAGAAMRRRRMRTAFA